MTRNEIITYTVDRAINNNLYISVQNGEVVVKAPWYLSRNQIQEIIEEKRKWIAEKLREHEQINANRSQIEKKNSFKILGKQYHLKVYYKNIKVPNLTVENNYVINVELPKKYKKASNQEVIHALIEKMYKVIAERQIEEAMEETRIKLGFAPEDYRFEKMENCLATCLEDKTIVINPEIAKYSKKTINYIILHEFCHLKYKRHVKGFYKMIESYMPDYQKYANEVSSFQY